MQCFEYPETPPGVAAPHQLNIHEARASLRCYAPGMRAYVAAELARRYGGKVIAPDQNPQPDLMPPLASFRLGRIIGTGRNVEAAIADWLERSALGVAQ